MDALAHRIASWLASEGRLPDEQRSVVAYGALTALNTVTALALMAAGGWFTGLLTVTLASAAVGGSYRVLTGGAHYTAPWRCSSASALTYLLLAAAASWLSRLPWRAETLALVGIAALALALWVVTVYAPTDTKAYRLSEAKKARLRRLSCGALGLGAAAWTAALLMGVSPVWLLVTVLSCTWQMITVTPAGFRMVHAVDHSMMRLGIGGGR